MPDNKTVEKMIRDHGFTKTYIATQLGVSRQAFSRKLHGRTRWTADDIHIIKNLLDLSREEAFDIFLGKE